ncbi:MAG: type II secretion system protein GspG [Leptospiraceae bacterium]|nr:type II secretion system protein GspG [Leptospiraceae bacterium]MCP5496863.1 type II secretion system protein GspG [Leptospiraceae bacterium]
MKLIHTSGKELQIENADIIGRKEGKHTTFFKKFDSVSGIHGTFYHKNKTWFYKDLGSTNGSSLNGTKIEPYKGVKISNGDKIRISEELFTVALESLSIKHLQTPQTKTVESGSKANSQDTTVVSTTNTQQKTELISSFYKGKQKFLENKNFIKFYPAIVLFVVVAIGIVGIILMSTGSLFKPKKSTELNEILNKPSFPKKQDETNPVAITNNQSIELIESSSKELKSKDQNYNVNNLIDNDLATCWKESEPGAGEGQWLEFQFKNTINIDKIRIANGFQKDNELFIQNNRLKTIYVCVNSYETCKQFSLKDTQGWEEFKLNEQNVTRLKLIIDSVYNGAKWDDTTISEIAFVTENKVSMPKQLSKKAFVNVKTNLLLRKEPKKNAPKVTTMPNGAEVEVINDNGPQDILEKKKSKWYKVRYEGEEGWVFGSYLEFSKESKKEALNEDKKILSKIKDDAKKLKIALKLYKKKFKAYPTKKQGLSALVEKPEKGAPENWEPVIEDKSALSDPWGNSYKLKLVKKKKPMILTYGRDKKKGGKGMDSDFNILNKDEYPE